MKILFVSALYHPNEIGGAEATVRILAEHAVSLGHEAVVVCMSADGKPHEAVIEGVKTYYVPLFNVFFAFGKKSPPHLLRPLYHMIDAYNPVMAARVAKIAAREAPDVVHIHNFQGLSCAVWDSLAKLRLPMVQTIHDQNSVCFNGIRFRHGKPCEGVCPQCRILCAPRRRSSRQVDVLTGVSKRILELVRDNGAYRGVEDVRVIHNCNVDDPLAEAPARDPSDRRLRIGFLGRLEEVKGPDILLQAVERMSSDDISVLIGGSGEADYEAKLKQRFLSPAVTFLGHVDPATFFTKIDVLVVPSVVEEALGRVVHEAFAYGVPVIASKIGGIPELIDPGRTGYLVPAGDVTALERTLSSLIHQPPDWSDLQHACLEEAQKFTLPVIYDAYVAAWLAAIEKHRSDEQAAGRLHYSDAAQ